MQLEGLKMKSTGWWQVGEGSIVPGLAFSSLCYQQDSFALPLLLSSLQGNKWRVPAFLRNCPVAGFGVYAAELPFPRAVCLGVW